jgi:hypothetical protein
MGSAIHARDGNIPPLTVDTIGRVLAAGLAGLLAWEAFSRLVAPLWIGGPLDPTGLIEMSLGVSGQPALLLHFVTGLVVFPVGYVFIVRPAALWIVPVLPWPVLGLAYGVGLWFFAMFIIASVIGGAPAFLGFQDLTWASLVGHLVMGTAIAWAANMLLAHRG